MSKCFKVAAWMLVVSAAVCVFLSCDKETPVVPGTEPHQPETPPLEAPSLALSSEGMIVYPSAAGRTYVRSFSVTPAGGGWSVSTSAPEGFRATVNYADQTGLGSVSLSVPEAFQGGGEIILSVRGEGGQAEGAFPVEGASIAADESVPVEAGASEKTLSIKANIPFTAYCPQSWVHIGSVSSGSVSFSVDESEETDIRRAAITLRDESETVSCIIIVSQAAKESPQADLSSLSDRELIRRIADKLVASGTPSSLFTEWYTDAAFSSMNGSIGGRTINGEEHVTYLDLRYSLRGTIPEEIGYLRYLGELWVSGNTGLTGTIPESFAHLENLKDLTLCDNALSGEIPSWLPGLKSARIISLSGNYFSGPLPAFLKDLPESVTNFEFHGNCLDGEIPQELTKTVWWNTPYPGEGSFKARPLGEVYLEMGQREGHSLWLAE